MKLAGETWSTRGKTCPSATLSTTNPTMTDPGSNPRLRGDRPATNRLSHGTEHLSITYCLLLSNTVLINFISDTPSLLSSPGFYEFLVTQRTAVGIWYLCTNRQVLDGTLYIKFLNQTESILFSLLLLFPIFLVIATFHHYFHLS
jgi:hypothetical protein